MKKSKTLVRALLVVLLVLASISAAQADTWKFAVWCDTRSDYSPGTLYSTTGVSLT